MAKILPSKIISARQVRKFMELLGFNKKEGYKLKVYPETLSFKIQVTFANSDVLYYDLYPEKNTFSLIDDNEGQDVNENKQHDKLWQDFLKKKRCKFFLWRCK